MSETPTPIDQSTIKGQCRSCGAGIEWAVSATSGKRVPMDAVPVEDGNIVLSSVEQGKPCIATVQSKESIERLKSEAKATGQRFVLFKSHFATCPQSNRWRKKKPVPKGKKSSSGIAAAQKKSIIPSSLEAWMDENDREIK